MDQANVIIEETSQDLAIKAFPGQAANETVVALDGTVESYNSQVLDGVLTRLEEQGHVNLVFACARLKYVSSIGMGVFMNHLSSVKKKNGSIVFAEVNEQVARVFENLGFSVFFTFRDSVDA